MKIVTAFTMIGKGDVLFTDQAMASKARRPAVAKKRLRFIDGDRVVELAIKAAEVAKKDDGEFLAFVVPEIAEAERAFIIGREYSIV
jgi:hypothetical protein